MTSCLANRANRHSLVRRHAVIGLVGIQDAPKSGRNTRGDGLPCVLGQNAISSSLTHRASIRDVV
jgi:hypothetical protein